VLLYALLCGFLPFDDENISSLYRYRNTYKILQYPGLRIRIFMVSL
jgi:hypothetical protein